MQVTRYLSSNLEQYIFSSLFSSLPLNIKSRLFFRNTHTCTHTLVSRTWKGVGQSVGEFEEISRRIVCHDKIQSSLPGFETLRAICYFSALISVMLVLRINTKFSRLLSTYFKIIFAASIHSSGIVPGLHDFPVTGNAHQTC